MGTKRSNLFNKCFVNQEKEEYTNLHKVVKYEMDDMSSLDIDNKLDWLFAETVSEYLKK